MRSYISNSWLVKIISNGRYLFSPDVKGRVFIWNLKTAKLVAILQDHSKIMHYSTHNISDTEEVRDLLLHPKLPLFLSCGDGE
jgi:WD40 repeat protein